MCIRIASVICSENMKRTVQKNKKNLLLSLLLQRSEEEKRQARKKKIEGKRKEIVVMIYGRGKAAKLGRKGRKNRIK